MAGLNKLHMQVWGNSNNYFNIIIQEISNYATAIEISWFYDLSNEIEFFEIFVDGVYNNRTYQSKSFALKLTPDTYYNIQVRGKMIGGGYTNLSRALVTKTAETEVLPYGSLLCYFDMNENNHDRVRYHNFLKTNISFENSPTGKSAFFNGSNSSINSNGWIDSDIEQETTFFAYLKSTSSLKQTIFGFEDSVTSGWGGLSVFNSNRGLWFYYGMGGAGYLNTGTGSFSLNEFHSVAVTRDVANSVIKIYIDGVLKASKNVSSVKTNNYQLIIGFSTKTGEGGPFSGNISAFGGFNRVLTQTEILEIHNKFNIGQHII